MVMYPGIEQSDNHPQEGVDCRDNGHHEPSPQSAIATVADGGAGERSMPTCQLVETLARDLEAMVFMYDKLRSVMDSSVDENLRVNAHNIAKSRVLGNILARGAEVVDGSPRQGRGRARSTPAHPRSPSPPRSSWSPSPSPSSSAGAGATAGRSASEREGRAVREGFSHREAGAFSKGSRPGDGSIDVTGFDLQAALGSSDIDEVKEHLRFLHGVAAQQETMLEVLDSEGMCAVDLNHKLSLKLLDKCNEFDTLQKAYFSLIEAEPTAVAAGASVPDGSKPTAAAAAIASPAIEPVTTGTTPPPLPRPPLSESAEAARREHARAFACVGIANSGTASGRGGWGNGVAGGGEASTVAPALGGYQYGRHPQETGRSSRTRSRAGSDVSVGSNLSVRAELFPAAESQQQQRRKEPRQQVEQAEAVWQRGHDGQALPWAAGHGGPGAGGDGVGAFGGSDRGLAVSSDGGSLLSSAATTPRKHPFQGPIGGATEGPSAPTLVSAPPQVASGYATEGEDGAGGVVGASGEPDREGQQMSFRAVRKKPAGGGGRAAFGRPSHPMDLSRFGGEPFGGGGSAGGFGGAASRSSGQDGSDAVEGVGDADGRGNESAASSSASAVAKSTTAGGGGEVRAIFAGGERSSTSYGSSVASFNGSFDGGAQQPPPETDGGPSYFGGSDDVGGSGARGGWPEAPPLGEGAINGDEGAARTEAEPEPDAETEATGYSEGGGHGFNSSPWSTGEEEGNGLFAGV